MPDQRTKCLLILITFTGAPVCLPAQISAGVKAAPILYGSLTYTSEKLDETADTGDWHWAPVNFGVFFNYTFKDNLGLQTGISPMVEVISCNTKDTDIDAGWFEFTYIEIPLLFLYKGKSRLRGFAEAGFSLQFLALAAHHYYLNELEEKYDARSYFNSVILKGNAGAGLMFDISKNFTLIAGSRLGYDITPAGKKSTIEKTGKVWSLYRLHPLHITIISIGIAYNF